MRRAQSYSSYFACHGLPEHRLAAALTRLPTAAPDVQRWTHGDTTILFAPPVANPLHRWHLSRLGEHVLFIQGEFFETPDLAGLASAQTGGVVDERRLGECLAALNGSFSGFIMQLGEPRMHAFTDRFGFAGLYLARRGQEVVASSSIWPLASDDIRGAVDQDAAKDILICGFPWFDRTLFSNVEVVLPGTIKLVSPEASGHWRYADYGRRRPSIVPADVVPRFRAVAAAHFTSMRQSFGQNECALSLSGGHDSRVVLNAMGSSGISPLCFVGCDGRPGADSRRAQFVARQAAAPCQVFNYSAIDPQDQADANVLVDGSNTGGWPMMLAKQAAPHVGGLYFGTSGDMLSGGWSVNPCKFKSLDALAEATFRAYYYEYAAPMDEFWPLFVNWGWPEVRERFIRTFPDDAEDIGRAFLQQRVTHRNFRRIRMFMQGAYLYVTPIHFFHDMRIVEFYHALDYPLLLWQRAHVRLCHLAHSRHAWVPATNYPIPVVWEPWLLPVARSLPVKSLIKRNQRSRPAAGSAGAMTIEPPILEALADHRPGLGLDVDRLAVLVETDQHGALLRLRAAGIALLLCPEILLSRSTLCGPKQVVAGTPALDAPSTARHD